MHDDTPIVMETTQCGIQWGHAMHIHPGGYCPGLWITGTSTGHQSIDSEQAPWVKGCFGHCDPEGWASPCHKPTELPRCPKCGHAPHGRYCLNMASDNDCDCRYVSVEVEQIKRERHNAR